MRKQAVAPPSIRPRRPSKHTLLRNRDALSREICTAESLKLWILGTLETGCRADSGRPAHVSRGPQQLAEGCLRPSPQGRGPAHGQRHQGWCMASSHSDAIYIQALEKEPEGKAAEARWQGRVRGPGRGVPKPHGPVLRATGKIAGPGLRSECRPGWGSKAAAACCRHQYLAKEDCFPCFVFHLFWVFTFSPRMPLHIFAAGPLDDPPSQEAG